MSDIYDSSPYPRCQSKCYICLGFCSDFILRLNTAYSEAVHWRQNLFTVPHCSAGHSFIKELSSLYRAYGDSTSLETVALKAAMVLPPLLLQRPHRRSTSHDHKRCLERRLQLWKDGNLLQLLQEGRTVQRRLQSSRAHSSQDSAKVFAGSCFRERLRQLFFLQFKGGFSSP